MASPERAAGIAALPFLLALSLKAARIRRKPRSQRPQST